MSDLPDYLDAIEHSKDDIPMTETPMKLRLAMAAWSVTHDEDERWDDAPAIEKHPYMLEVDAILREMLEPSEGMLFQAHLAYGKRHPALFLPALRNAWRAMIQHIIDQD